MNSSVNFFYHHRQHKPGIEGIESHVIQEFSLLDDVELDDFAIYCLPGSAPVEEVISIHYWTVEILGRKTINVRILGRKDIVLLFRRF